mmetsp:Transcript_1536/g.3281  ORF Transcript_1536/g.3281 Transcript_1536/m.3281 type:complete len:250 (+) Transcript_1536:355-1104(+)
MGKNMFFLSTLKGPLLPVGSSLELVGVLRRDALGRQQLPEGRVDLDLSGHEGVVLPRRSRVLHELLLHDLLNDLPSVRDAVHRLRHLRRHHHHAVLIPDDGVPRPHRHAREVHDLVAPPGLHGRGTLTCRGAVGEAGEAVVDDLVGVADGAVGDEASDLALLEAEELDVAADGLLGAHGGHDEDLIRTAKLERLVLRAVPPRRFVRRDVRPRRNELQRHGPTDALVTRVKRSGPVDLSRGPSHDPKAVD